MKYHTSAAYISGGICGDIWMPQTTCGKDIQANLRGPFGIMDRFTEPASFRDALLSLLMREGGDFQNAEYTADTVIRIERKSVIEGGKYNVHVKEISIADIEPDLVNGDYYTSDFWI